MPQSMKEQSQTKIIHQYVDGHLSLVDQVLSSSFQLYNVEDQKLQLRLLLERDGV